MNLNETLLTSVNIINKVARLGFVNIYHTELSYLYGMLHTLEILTNISTTVVFDYQSDDELLSIITLKFNTESGVKKL